MVKFISGKTYMKSDKLLAILDNRPALLMYSGRKELVLECEDNVLTDKLISLASTQDTHFPQIKPLVEFLTKEGIEYFIDGGKTTKI